MFCILCSVADLSTAGQCDIIHNKMYNRIKYVKFSRAEGQPAVHCSHTYCEDSIFEFELYSNKFAVSEGDTPCHEVLLNAYLNIILGILYHKIADLYP